MQDLINKALHAAEQNMTDVLTLWVNGRTSDLVLGEALKDMKNDGLKLVKAARKAIASAPAAVSLTEREEGGGGVLAMFPHAPALSDKELSAMLLSHREAVDEWYGAGNNERSREATQAETDRGALLAEVARLRALAASPASVSSPQRLPAELEWLLTAYADLAASHDDALPITAEVEEGLLGLYHNDGTPIEADQRLADFVAAACNFVGAGFVADMKAFAAGESATATPLGVVEPAGAASPTRKGSSEWVPVGERLPEAGRKVWVAVKERHHYRFGGAVVMRSYTPTIPGKLEQSFADNDSENIAVESVSHWMYADIPTPPQP